MSGAGTKAIRRGALARGKRVRAASQARREKRWSMLIYRDAQYQRFIYADGSPIDQADPRYPRYASVMGMENRVVRRLPPDRKSR